MSFIRGEILYDIEFTYPNSTVLCDKLLLIVNKKHSDPEDVVIIPATTHKDNYTYKPNCNPIERVFYFDGQMGFYKPKTILQLYLIDLISCDLINSYINSGRVKRLNKTTTQQEFGMIMNCLKQMKEDIEFFVQDLIF